MSGVLNLSMETSANDKTERAPEATAQDADAGISSSPAQDGVEDTQIKVTISDAKLTESVSFKN